MPGLLDSLREWFKDYKIPDGKPVNEFTFGGEYKDADYAVKVIQECHERWGKLIKGEFKELEDAPVVKNVTVDGSSEKLSELSIAVEESLQDVEIPSELQTTHYCKQN
ncbi:unnamed protein product [Ambrosiozyma monospora]|uniref:inorganic diphosphatase n=1 Tax=Ambrosiozyma monospora TaxID=43982 RepID=A0A9W6WKJ1_AMBMO|nr:unnamed protein product [Ambrosiozyma monospora]GME81002.1 unnamed protein product [Ambrosiozyma monospora]